MDLAVWIGAAVAIIGGLVVAYWASAGRTDNTLKGSGTE